MSYRLSYTYLGPPILYADKEMLPGDRHSFMMATNYALVAYKTWSSPRFGVPVTDVTLDVLVTDPDTHEQRWLQVQPSPEATP